MRFSSQLCWSKSKTSTSFGVTAPDSRRPAELHRPLPVPDRPGPRYAFPKHMKQEGAGRDRAARSRRQSARASRPSFLERTAYSVQPVGHLPILRGTGRLTAGWQRGPTPKATGSLGLQHSFRAGGENSRQRIEKRMGTVRSSCACGMFVGNAGSGSARMIISITSLSRSGWPELRAIWRAST